MNDLVFAFFDSWAQAYVDFCAWVYLTEHILLSCGFTALSLKLVAKLFISLCAMNVLVYFLYVSLFFVLLSLFIDHVVFGDKK